MSCDASLVCAGAGAAVELEVGSTVEVSNTIELLVGVAIEEEVDGELVGALVDVEEGIDDVVLEIREDEVVEEDGEEEEELDEDGAALEESEEGSFFPSSFPKPTKGIRGSIL